MTKMETAYIRLGVIKRVRGLRGHLIALLEKQVTSLDAVDSLFIQLGHTLVPYALEHYTLQNQRVILKLQAVNDPATAYQLRGSAFFASRDALPTQVVEQELLQALQGYQVVDIVRGELGAVVRVDHLPLQTLLVVNYQARELLIPYHAALIQQIDHCQQRMLVRLPPGLVEALC